jgi:type I restriction enzyme, S subunit
VSFPRYAKYKPSGVEWLGEVPEHWQVIGLGMRYTVELGKMLDSKRVTGAFLRPYLRNTDVQWGVIRVDDLPTMDFEPEEVERFLLRYGDLLVCEGGEVGRCAIWRDEQPGACYQKALHRVRPLQPSLDVPEFLYWCLCAAAGAGTFTADESKATIAHLPAESFRKYRFPFPSTAEQRAIAAFLDRETARIDALVAEQERLIELLREKRQAVISHAVTKGLDPSVPMKDSGVEWSGAVPAHWEVIGLGMRYSVELGKMLDSKRVTGAFLRPYLRNTDVQWGVIRVDDLPTMDFEPDEVERFLLRYGDLLVCEGGEVGRCAIWRDEQPGACYQKALHRVRPLQPSLDVPEFLYWCLCAAALAGTFTAD